MAARLERTSGVTCAMCAKLPTAPNRSRAYRPQTKGKAERLIQSALREQADRSLYKHSSEPISMLAH